MIKTHPIFFTLLCLLLVSCSTEHPKNESYLQVDYRVDLGYFKDLTVNTDHHVYALSLISGASGDQLELQKISPDGNPTSLYRYDAYFLNHPKMTNDASGKIYWTADNLNGTIYSFMSNYQPFTVYTMQGAEQMNLRMNELKTLNNNTLVVYDSQFRKFKLYSQTLNTDFAIAGSDTYAVIDGMGSQASFVFVSRINTLNNVIYALDAQRYIRKIDCNTNDYQVSTLYDLYADVVLDFAIATNGDVYALIQNKGIYKLSNGNSSVFKSGTEKIKTAHKNGFTTIDWSDFTKIYISENDLYLVSGYGTLTKISNFTEKL